MKMLELACVLSQQLPNSLVNTNETSTAAHNCDLGTLDKKLQESNRISAQRMQSADYKEIQREFEMKQLRRHLKSLSEKIDSLEKQQQKMQLKLAENADMQFRLKSWIDEKTDCIHKIKKSVKNQSKSIKQIEDTFRSIAINKEVISLGTSFSDIKRKNNQGILSLIDNDR